MALMYVAVAVGGALGSVLRYIYCLNWRRRHWEPPFHTGHGL